MIFFIFLIIFFVLRTKGVFFRPFLCSFLLLGLLLVPHTCAKWLVCEKNKPELSFTCFVSACPIDGKSSQHTFRNYVNSKYSTEDSVNESEELEQLIKKGSFPRAYLPCTHYMHAFALLSFFWTQSRAQPFFFGPTARFAHSQARTHARAHARTRTRTRTFHNNSPQPQQTTAIKKLSLPTFVAL